MGDINPKKIDVEKHVKAIPFVAIVKADWGSTVISKEKMLVVEVYQEPQSIQFWFTQPGELTKNEFSFIEDITKHIIKEVKEELQKGVTTLNELF